MNAHFIGSKDKIDFSKLDLSTRLCDFSVYRSWKTVLQKVSKWKSCSSIKIIWRFFPRYYRRKLSFIL